MRIAICDDEEEVRKALIEKVSAMFPESSAEAFSCGEELLRQEAPPDILLLDIRLTGLDGMETARQLRKRGWKTVLIFITGEEGHVFDSFDVQAFHYLVKPFSDEKLQAVLTRALAQCRETKPVEKRYTMITSGGKHIRLCMDDVVYAEVFNSQLIVHTVDSELMYYGKLKDFEKLAGDGFFRTHRAFLVNLQFIVKYDATTVYFSNGSALMSRRNYPAFVKAFMNYHSSGRV